jgi:hypothetical protein
MSEAARGLQPVQHLRMALDLIVHIDQQHVRPVAIKPQQARIRYAGRRHHPVVPVTATAISRPFKTAPR